MSQTDPRFRCYEPHSTEAERDLLAFLREPETTMAIRGGESALRRLSERGTDTERAFLAGAARELRTLLAKIDALGDAGTDDGGQP